MEIILKTDLIRLLYLGIVMRNKIFLFFCSRECDRLCEEMAVLILYLCVFPFHADFSWAIQFAFFTGTIAKVIQADLKVLVHWGLSSLLLVLKIL